MYKKLLNNLTKLAFDHSALLQVNSCYVLLITAWVQDF